MACALRRYGVTDSGSKLQAEHWILTHFFGVGVNPSLEPQPCADHHSIPAVNAPEKNESVANADFSFVSQGYQNQIGNQPAKVASVHRLNQSPFTVPFKYVRISLDCEVPLADTQ
ncbi:MAG: hypothetical protein P8X89_19970 [Reinekea sp.]